MPGSYDIGDRVEIRVVFRDRQGAPADPTVATLTVMAPSGALTTPALAKQSPGTYAAEVTITMAGIWKYRAKGEGAVVAAGEGQIFVAKSAFPDP